MSITILFFLLASVVLVVKRPATGALVVLFTISLSPIIDSVFPQIFRNVWVLIVFLVQFVIGAKKKLITNTIIIYIAAVVFKEVFSFFILGNVNSLVLSIYVYIVIFGVAYFTYKFSKSTDEFWNYYKIYIVVCLLIQFYRTLFDYSFFGLATMNDDVQFASLYEFGGEHFRPASLQGSIIYAIELAIFISIILLKKGINKKNAIFIALAMIGLILTYSRSGLLIVGISVAYYFIKKKQIIKASVLAVLLLGLLSIFQYGERLNESTDLSSDTYQGRFMSIAMTLNTIERLNIEDYIFGVGYGRANYVQEDGTVEYYVEDYFLSVIINSGILTLIALIAYFVKAIKKGLRRHCIETIPFIGLILVNILASSMLAYTVQILFWILTFSIFIPLKRNQLSSYEKA